MKLFVGSDHAGFELKQHLLEHLRSHGHEVVDLGPASDVRCDYPDYAAAVARAVRDDASGARGVLVCGSGIGVCIAANKVRGIRAADAWDEETARVSRAHNDANVLCLAGRMLPTSAAVGILDVWLRTGFDGGRHAERVAKIALIEETETETAAAKGVRS